MLFWHLGGTTALARYAFRDERMDLRMLALGAIMPDLIDTVQIDAKHSTQDVVEPIALTKQNWGDQVALLGGADIDFMIRSTPDQIAAYARHILDACMPGGRFTFGLGNWVEDAIPPENYLTLVAQTRAYA